MPQRNLTKRDNIFKERERYKRGCNVRIIKIAAKSKVFGVTKMNSDTPDIV